MLTVPPGEHSLEKASRISIRDLNPGDRLYMRATGQTLIFRFAPARQVSRYVGGTPKEETE